MPIGINDDDDEKDERDITDNLRSDSAENKTHNNKNTIIVVGIAGIIVLIIVVMISSIIKSGKTQDADNSSMEGTVLGSSSTISSVSDTQSVNTTVEVATDETGNTVESIMVGMPEFNPRENGPTTAIVYSASDYIKDLNGSDIPAVYNVANRSYVRDFANYEKKRAIIDDGMEMYWLEISYSGKSYRCQVPFYIFKDLETTGICVVEIELLTLEGGEQVISFMQVVSNYNELIND